jgi:large subunit ribosomal protein L27
VIPGNIIFRQRGTGWFPGENCKFGRDHCIFSMASGYVRYYRDPLKHPKRQYIGVAFEKDESLPYPQNGARRRRLNMLPVQMEAEAVQMPEAQLVVGDVQTEGGPAEITASIAEPQKNKSGTVLAMGKSGYAFRESNWAIGRAAEVANVQVKKFIPGDRFTAWQKSKARITLNEEKKRLRMAGKKTAKPKARQPRRS